MSAEWPLPKNRAPLALAAQAPCHLFSPSLNGALADTSFPDQGRPKRSEALPGASRVWQEPRIRVRCEVESRGRAWAAATWRQARGVCMSKKVGQEGQWEEDPSEAWLAQPHRGIPSVPFCLGAPLPGWDSEDPPHRGHKYHSQNPARFNARGREAM